MSRDQANIIAAVKILKDRLTRFDSEARGQLRELMEPGDAVRADLNGVKLGRIQMREPSLSARVTDRDEFLAWVKQDRPDEIQTVETVTAFHEKNCLDRAKEGEIIPGIELTEGTPTLALTQVPSDAYDTVMDAVREGRLELGQ